VLSSSACSLSYFICCNNLTDSVSFPLILFFSCSYYVVCDSSSLSLRANCSFSYSYLSATSCFCLVSSANLRTNSPILALSSGQSSCNLAPLDLDRESCTLGNTVCYLWTFCLVVDCFSLVGTTRSTDFLGEGLEGLSYSRWGGESDCRILYESKSSMSLKLYCFDKVS